MFEIYDLVRVDHFVECPQGSHNGEYRGGFREMSTFRYGR
jgi:hypothetical protein